MAAFPPGRQAALELPHARRWLDGWGDELGFAWEADGRVVGAAWARVVEPVLASDGSGRAVPEAIVAVSEEARGRGIGRRLMAALMDRARAEGHGLVLTVSERNPVAARLYERLGFRRVDQTPAGLLTMLWP
jgi:GNAT superfamily N-acetyltransferase